jgi:CrcB protein
MNVLVWTAVVLIGGCAAVVRFVVDAAVGTWSGREFPLGTLVVNITGSLLLGLLTGLALGDDQELLAGTAAVGSYTTFSTWILESHRLVEEGEAGAGVANLAGSLVIGLAVAALGRWIAGAL